MTAADILLLTSIIIPSLEVLVVVRSSSTLAAVRKIRLHDHNTPAYGIRPSSAIC